MSAAEDEPPSPSETSATTVPAGQAAPPRFRVAPTTVVLADLSVDVDRESGPLNAIAKKLGLDGKAKAAKPAGPGAADAVELEAGAASASPPAGDSVRLVRNVSAAIPAGKVTAIMGSSGAGKTTLLNAIAARLSGSARPVGQILFNGVDVVPLRKKGRGGRCAYVRQEDTLLPYLTVRETLRYNAELRLPTGMATAEKHRLVEDVILELNLKECADTMVGNPSSTSSSSRGCSSGERRLVSIAIQLLSSPSLLLLDEPTSSLDSFTSSAVVQTLKTIANDGRTVILSVHQPRYSSFELFDNLILLCKGGHLVYSGPASEVRTYFEDLLGVRMDPETNIADWILDLSSVDYSSPAAEEASKKRLEMLAAVWKERAARDLAGAIPANVKSDHPDRESTMQEQQVPASNPAARFLVELSTMTRRGYRNTWRDKGSLFGIFGESAIFALFIGAIFFQLPNDLASVRSMQTLILVCVSGQGYLMMILFLYLLSKDVQLFDAERVDGVVGVGSYVVSRMLCHLPFFVVCPLIYSGVVYAMAGLRAGQFGWAFAAQVSTVFGYWSIAFLCVALTRQFNTASVTANSLAMIPNYAMGFNMVISTMPVWIAWTRYIVTTYYAYQMMYISQYRGRMLDCPYPPGNAQCAAYSGDIIIQQFGFDPNTNLASLIGLSAASVIGWVLAACAALLLVTKEPVTAGVVAAETHAVRFEGEDGAAADGEVAVKIGTDLGHRTLAEEHQVHILAENLALEVQSVGITLKSQRKQILRSITMAFEPGKITVIMGSGGSGKTSVLNAICNVKPGASLSTKTARTGNVSFGTVRNPSSGVVVRYASYVRKENDNLYPTLTVRETLMFSAKLRLYNMTEEQRRERIENVIRTLGLSDCANTLVGDANLKGISGGEQRRVCIALGILEEEVAVLCLDEPATGLDSSAALTVITVLRKIADTGRTVILTSQQTSRPEAFNQFDNVLLLSRGGEVAYAGPRTEMVPFFERLGFSIPEFVQPADYVIDLSSVDLRNHAAEAESRARVAGIVESYRVAAAESFGARSVAETAVDGPASAKAVDTAEIKHRTPFFKSVPVLYARTMRNFRRKPAEPIDFLVMPGGFALVTLVFYQNSIRVANFESVQNTLGLLFNIPSLLFMGLLGSAAHYPPDRAFFTREYADGVTSVESFTFTQLVVQLPFMVGGALLWVLLGTTATGMQIGFGAAFAANLLVTTCFLICGTSIGLSILTLVDDIGLGLVVASAINSVFIMMSGIGAQSIPAFLYYINYISPLRWGIPVLTNLEFTGATFSCAPTPDQAYPNGTCIISTGEQVLNTLDLADVNLGVNLGVLVAITVATRLVYYGLLKLKMHRMVS
ncbi:P-loop containing nucleoside triphosphate hydrolase protein [Hyaloraphidium curvatum]|nr:P-loop containing nucleoside triphosphate hydrolase protein [Hyaloraphidium curvatum]